MTPPDSDTSHPAFLNGPGAVRALMRAHDWAGSPLGPPAGWPQPLQTIAGIMLAANEAMFTAWGPARAVIYNDAYAAILGGRHPAALGRPFAEVWPELTAAAFPYVDLAYAGEPTTKDDIPLVLDRHGVPEARFFSFFYAPVLLEDGAVGGLFCACHETTQRVQAAQAQRAAEARNRQILDGAVDYAIIANDPDGCVTRWNEGARRILGWTEAEMLGRSVMAIFTPEDQAQGELWHEMRQAAEAGRGTDERWHVRKSGERFWADGELTPLRDEAGGIAGFVKVLRDRTQERAAQALLRESEARFRTLAEAIPGFVWTADRHGTLTYTSPRWQAYTGRSPDRAGGPPGGRAGDGGWLDAIHPDDRDRVRASWFASVAQGAVHEAELRLRAASGEYRWWLSRALPVREDGGETTVWAGVCTDIQDMVESREALARSREELEALVAARTADRNRLWRLSRDIMLVARFDGTITAVNPAWTSLLGWGEPELLGRSYLDFVHPDDLAATRAVSARLAQGATIQHFTNRYLHRDGTLRWISWTSVPDEAFLHAVGRDITGEREQAAALARAEDALRQSQKMEAVGQLTGGIAHDFNNLLTGIIGSLELLQTRLAQQRYDTMPRYISTAQAAANRAAALTHRLLAFSRRQRLDPRPTDANALIASMEDLIRRTVGPAIELRTLGEPALWLTLCDPNQLENAILNLCINARDAMPGGGRLTIETANGTYSPHAARERDLAPGDYVEICVEDTGTGMAPDVAARAFDPFFTTKPMGQGTGLGLSMIYGFAKQSGGQVRLTTALGAGTVIRITLPRYAGAQPRETALAEAGQAPRARDGETILVVDDEAAVRMLVAEVLQDLGYTALDAPDGAQALAILKSGVRIDLLVTDVGMPGGMNGRQLADAARALRPGLRVLFITGYAENTVLGSGDLGPGMHVVTKPFAMDVLTGRVRAIIRGE